MSTTRWRGTLIYTGTVAAIGAAGIARFVVTPDAAPAAASGIGASDGQSSASSSGSASGRTSGSASGSTAGSSATDTTGGGTTTSDSVTVVGSVASTRYGNVQVSVTFQGDTITDVQTLQAPDRERESQQISSRSVPVLAQEVLDTQSAHVDTVSGATYTSEGYRESVQSAIDQRG